MSENDQQILDILDRLSQTLATFVVVPDAPAPAPAPTPAPTAPAAWGYARHARPTKETT